MTVPENLPKVFASIVALADMGPGATWNMLEGDTFDQAVTKEVDMMTGAGGDIMDVYDPDALGKAKFQIENPDAVMTPWGPGLDPADIDLMMDDSIGLGTLIGLSDTEMRDVMKDADDLLKEDGGNFITDIWDHAQDISMKFNEDPWSLAMNFVDSLLPSGNGADWDPTIDVSGTMGPDGMPPVQTMGSGDIQSILGPIGGYGATALGAAGGAIKDVFESLNVPYWMRTDTGLDEETRQRIEEQKQFDLDHDKDYAMLDSILEPDTGPPSEITYGATPPEIIGEIADYMKSGVTANVMSGWVASRSDVLAEKDPALIQNLQTTIQQNQNVVGINDPDYTDAIVTSKVTPAPAGDMTDSTLNAMGITGSVAEGTRAAGLDEDPTDTAKLLQVFFEEVEKRPGGKSQQVQNRIPNMFYESLPLFYLWAGTEIVKGEYDTESLYRMWAGHPNQGYIDNPAQFNSGPNYLKKVNEVRQVLENNNADVAWLSQYPGLNWVVSTFGDKPTYQRQLMKFALTNGATGAMASGIHKDLDDQWNRRIAKGATELELFSDVMLSLGAPEAGLQGTYSLNYPQYTTGTGDVPLAMSSPTGTLPTLGPVGANPLTSTLAESSTPAELGGAEGAAYANILQDEYQHFQDYLGQVQHGLDTGQYGIHNPPPAYDPPDHFISTYTDPTTGEKSIKIPDAYSVYGDERSYFQQKELASMPEPFDDAENKKRMKGKPYMTGVWTGGSLAVWNAMSEEKKKKIRGGDAWKSSTSFVPTKQWGIQHGFRDAGGKLLKHTTEGLGKPAGSTLDDEAENMAKMKQLAAQHMAKEKKRQEDQLKVHGTTATLEGDIGKVMSKIGNI